MKLGVIIPQGWTGDYDGWDPSKAWARSVTLAKQADELGIESIWVFDHFHTVPRPTDEITFESFTMLVGAGRGHDPGPARARRDLHRVPEPRPDGQDDLDDGRHQRRPDGARDRRRLEARRVGRLRLRVPGDARAAGSPGRRPRGREPDDGRRQAPARDLRRQLLERHGRPQRPQADPAAAGPDHGRRQRAQRHLAPGGEARRRAEPRRDGPVRGGRRPADRPRAVRGDRPRPGDARDLGPHVVGPHQGRPGSSASTGWPGSASSASAA